MTDETETSPAAALASSGKIDVKSDGEDKPFEASDTDNGGVDTNGGGRGPGRGGRGGRGGRRGARLCMAPAWRWRAAEAERCYLGRGEHKRIQLKAERFDHAVPGYHCVATKRRRMISPAKVLLLCRGAFFAVLAASAKVSETSKDPPRQEHHHPRAPLNRPNFIVLFMDDLGYGDVGFTGHPTTSTPNIDKLAWNGKVLTTWYSGCAVCSGSRAALMTGRQYPRTGVPGVLGPTGAVGLPLNETTVAEQLKQAGYATAAVGKWHLGQRPVYLPGSRGFDVYLGVPYSDDMGLANASPCRNDHDDSSSTVGNDQYPWDCEHYAQSGYIQSNECKSTSTGDPDPAGSHLPLVYQEHNRTRVVEQPLDFTTLAQKYESFATKFIQQNKNDPFFLYVPFSHVHVTRSNQPESQYAGCSWKNATERGAFGDALAEADGIVGAIAKALKDLNLEENTLVLFASDNGPWLIKCLSGGSMGLLNGRFADYWNTGKASTWEGGIRSPSFAYWKGVIKPFSRSAEVVSSLDVLPTLSALAGVPLPPDRVIDGRDMSDIILHDGKSKHDFLFIYGTCHLEGSGRAYGISAVRHGKFKAHFCTSPGGGGNQSLAIRYNEYPLLFNIDKDPSESIPISTGEMPSDPDDQDAMERIMKAYAMEKSTFVYGRIIPEPDGPGEGPGRYGICCDRSRDCDCSDVEGKTDMASILFNIGTKQHHDRYHEELGEDQPSPPATLEQALLNAGDDVGAAKKLRRE